MFVFEKDLQTWAPECDTWNRPHDLSDHWCKKDERHLKQMWDNLWPGAQSQNLEPEIHRSSAGCSHLTGLWISGPLIVSINHWNWGSSVMRHCCGMADRYGEARVTWVMALVCGRHCRIVTPHEFAKTINCPILILPPCTFFSGTSCRLKTL